MRYLLWALVLGLGVELYVVSDEALLRRLSTAVHSFVYEKEIVLTGDRRIDRSELDSLLPRSASILWWHLNPSLIRAQLLTHPFIEQVEIGKCDGGSWRCFAITIKERTPAYLVKLDSKAWLAAEDGTFLTPSSSLADPAVLEHFLEGEGRSLIAITGIDAAGTAPDLTRGRLLYARDALRVIESEVKRRPKTIELTRSGELNVTFRGAPFRATFGFGGNDLSALGEEGRRLALLLTKFEGREHLVREVDLAFKKIAVVRLIQSVPRKEGVKRKGKGSSPREKGGQKIRETTASASRTRRTT
jgi:hypothetical protein